MTGEPPVSGRQLPDREARVVALQQAAELLDPAAPAIVERWLERLATSVYGARADLQSESLRNAALELVRGVAQALRSAEPEAMRSSWTRLARQYAALRLAQQVPADELLLECRLLRQVLWQTFEEGSAGATPGDLFEVARCLDGLVGAVASTVANAPGGGPEPVQQAEHQEEGPQALPSRVSAECESIRGLLEAVLEHVPSGVFFGEAPEGRLLLGNRQAERIWRQPFIPSPTVAGYRAYRGFHPDGRPYEPEEWPLARALAGEVIRSEEIHLLRGDGTIGITLQNAAPVRDHEGRIVAAVVVLTDVTEARQYEQALRESESRFRLLAENAQDLIYRFRLKPSRGFEYVSPSATRIVGYTPEEHYANPDLGVKLVHPEDRPLLEAVASGRLTTVTLRWVRKDGRVIWTEQRNVPIYDDKGELVAIEGIARDVTERERLLREVQDRAADLEAIFENTDAHLALLDRDFRFLLVNSAYSRGSGYSKEQLIGQNHFALFPNPENQAIFERTRDTGEPYRAVEKPFEFPGQPWRGVTYWNWVLAPIKGADGRTERLLLSLTDVTPQVRTRQEVERLAEVAQGRAAELERLEEQRNDIMRAVSHDLRNPLAAILGQAQLLDRRLEKAGLTGREREGARAIIAAAERMNTMIQDLVDATRSEAGQLKLERQPVNLPNFLAGLKRQQAAALPMERVEVQAPAALPAVSADPARLERILDRAAELRMAVIVGLAYFGMDHRYLESPDAIRRMVDAFVDWLAARNYRHVLIEVANEATRIRSRTGEVGALELMERIRARSRVAYPDGFTLLCATSLGGGGMHGDEYL
ncbi:MAG: PAS domain S-box protein, partial [Anaerolineae bacterium]|nr:PAS domain S-box protein [Anaerolineae bacterium]